MITPDLPDQSFVLVPAVAVRRPRSEDNPLDRGRWKNGQLLAMAWSVGLEQHKQRLLGRGPVTGAQTRSRRARR